MKVTELYMGRENWMTLVQVYHTYASKRIQYTLGT